MQRKSESLAGSALVETMIAFVIMSLAASVVYPLFINAKKTSKLGDAKLLCLNLVKSKLDEYKYGRAIDFANDALGNAYLSQLSLDNLTQTSVDTTTNPPTIKNVSGFYYSKFRYNRYYSNGSCNGVSGSVTFGPLLGAVGMRECVGENTVLTADPSAFLNSSSAPYCASAADIKAENELPGFRLYTKLELATPWNFPINAGAANANQIARFDSLCPDSNAGTASSPLYDFNGSGDAVRVTVTGIIDLASRGLTEFAGIPSNVVSSLMCSATAVVYPPTQKVRYYLDPTGKIFSVQGSGLNGSQNNGAAGTWAFQNIFRQGTIDASGIRAIAVHPRNYSIYVLRPGSLVRYSNCFGVPIDCNTTPDVPGGALTGISDDGQALRPNYQEFTVPPNIRGIAINFLTGDVYGLLNSHNVALVNVTSSTGGTLSAVTAVADIATTSTQSLTTYPFLNIPNPQRVTGFFMDPSGDSLFVSDRAGNPVLQGANAYSSNRVSASNSTVYLLGGNTDYNSSVYRVGTDVSLNFPVFQAPVNAITFSK